MLNHQRDIDRAVIKLIENAFICFQFSQNKENIYFQINHVYIFKKYN